MNREWESATKSACLLLRVNGLHDLHNVQRSTLLASSRAEHCFRGGCLHRLHGRNVTRLSYSSHCIFLFLTHYYCKKSWVINSFNGNFNWISLCIVGTTVLGLKVINAMFWVWRSGNTAGGAPQCWVGRRPRCYPLSHPSYPSSQPSNL